MKVALQGGAYQARSVIASAQRSLNLFAEPMPEAQGEPMPAACYPTPGTTLLGVIGTGPIRGIRQSTTGGIFVVSGNGVYSVDPTTWAGTHLGDITFGLRTPVSMADNGLDMVIVDGTANGWKITLVGNVFAPVVQSGTIPPVATTGSEAITADKARYVSFTAPYNALVSRLTLTLATGYTGHMKCSIFDKDAVELGPANDMTNPATGLNDFILPSPVSIAKGEKYWVGFVSDKTLGTWSVGAADPTKGQTSDTAYAVFPVNAPPHTPAAPLIVTVTIATDPGGMFVGGDVVDYLDTYLLFNKPKTPQFYSSDSLALTFDPLWFANKETYSDLLVTMRVVHGNIWLLGEKTTEIFADVGKPDFPFEKQPDVFIDHGVVAKYSPAVYDNGLFWLSRDRQGQGIVIMGAGYQTKRISTYAIENEIAGYPRIDDAIGYCYQLAGHAFYVIAFPAADKTWSYDITTGQWHEWAWIDANGAEHRHRSNCFWPCNGRLVVGDWENGNLYALDHRVFTDNGRPIKRVRSFPHVVNDGKRVFYRNFIADFDAGNAPQEAITAPSGPPYNTSLTQINTNINGLGRANTAWGFPANTNFHTLLMSYWMCGPAAVPGVGTGVCGFWPEFNSASFFTFEAAGAGGTGLSFSNQTLGALAHFFRGDFALPSPPGMLMHFLLSVDTHTQTVQVYINDQAVPVTGGTWTGTPPFDFNVANNINIWAWDVSDVITSGRFPALADAWISNPPAFVDLSVVANRRKFINANLTPVDLGDTGAVPFGYQPAMYMSVRPGGVPTDILLNRGRGGGSWNADTAPPTLQAGGACSLPPAPPEPPPSTPPPLTSNLISLSWSNDAGHTYGNPVSQNIGAAGEYRTSLQWQRLGLARSRVFEISWSVPMHTALQGCYVDVTPGSS